MLLLVGTCFGPYEILSLIGAGGIGEVYKARATRIGRDVALKVLKPGSRDEMWRHRFEQEARAAGALTRPNIVAVYDVGCENGIHFIISELVSGDSLSAVLRQGPLAEVNRDGTSAQLLADGLAVAHMAHEHLLPRAPNSERRQPPLRTGSDQYSNAAAQARPASGRDRMLVEAERQLDWHRACTRYSDPSVAERSLTAYQRAYQLFTETRLLLTSGALQARAGRHQLARQQFDEVIRLVTSGRIWIWRLSDASGEAALLRSWRAGVLPTPDSFFRTLRDDDI